MFIFEMANNHNGSVEHGLNIIRGIKAVCQNFDFEFAFKMQYRNLETFIHPDYKNNMEIKYIKRFSDTKLKENDYKILLDEMKKLGFKTICTAFDEDSVDLIIKHDFEIIKVASVSFTDWPLLEKIVQYDKPMILSTAGATLEEIDNVVNFLKNRNKQFSLMHCVAEYPTKTQNLQLNQIDLLKKLYPEIQIGYSTHEAPESTESVALAIAKGAAIFEKHVDIKEDGFSMNAYSSTPEQVEKWLESAQKALIACGEVDKRYEFSDSEINSLKSLSRGVFAKKDIKKGEIIERKDIFLAMPKFDNQLVANDLSKYKTFVAKVDIKTNEPLYNNNLEIKDTRKNVQNIIEKIQTFLTNSQITVPNRSYFELSHHYGIEKFEETGAAIIDCINREYCKKLLILLPNQKHPSHLHKLKEETFLILYGSAYINVDGVEKKCSKGDMVLVERGKKHSFWTEEGVIFEEISTTHYKDDSFYEEEAIINNKNRKTSLIFNNKS